MAKSLLRSGNLADLFALGENGQPVYASALQLRETLRLRRQQNVADCLAIPQPNEAGDRIDWYAPFDGKATSWLAAGDDERDAALETLAACQKTVAEISDRAQRAEKPAQQLFGALLAKAFQFPAANYVYLVDGRPVITFWGFINLDQKPRADALECLRQALPAITAKDLVDVAPPAAPAALAYAETSALPPEPAEEPESEPAPPVPMPPAAARGATPPSRIRRWWWALPGVALAGGLIWQLRDDATQTPPAAAATAEIKPEKRVLPVSEPAPQPAPDVIGAAPAEPAPPVAVAVEPSLPAQPATVVAAEQQPAPPAQENAPAPAPSAKARPVEKNALVMPALAVKLGKTDFLNGTWRVVAEIKTPSTGKPPSLRYQMKNGQGTVRITHGDGITCRTNVNAGLMQSGNLVINSRSKARCSDGSRYQMPEIVCSQGLSGPAECTGRYDAETVLPMSIKRESE